MFAKRETFRALTAPEVVKANLIDSFRYGGYQGDPYGNYFRQRSIMEYVDDDYFSHDIRIFNGLNQRGNPDHFMGYRRKSSDTIVQCPHGGVLMDFDHTLFKDLHMTYAHADIFSTISTTSSSPSYFDPYKFQGAAAFYVQRRHVNDGILQSSDDGAEASTICIAGYAPNSQFDCGLFQYDTISYYRIQP
jgi:hypothetical protein